MSDWSAIFTAVPAAVREVLGSSFDVGWNNREARWRSSVNCRLSIVSKSLLGRTEIRRTDNGDGTFTERSYTPATTTVQFTFDAQDQDLWQSALPLAEQAAAALRRSDVYAILCDAGLGVASVGGLTVQDYRDAEGRWRSAVTFDAVLNSHVSIAQLPGATAYGYIENVVVNDLEIPEIELALPILLEAGTPLLTEVGDPILTEGRDA